MLSGAQLGITVTALLVGYAAEPYLGAGLAELLGGVGVSTGISLPLSVALALLIATVVQMVLGELAPKNLAIARPELLARALSRSTLIYLKVAGPLITLFDPPALRLLRRIGIEPIEELPSGATPADLEQIIAESREEGHLDAEMSDLLDRGLDFRRADRRGGHGPPASTCTPSGRTSRSAGWSSCSTPATPASRYAAPRASTTWSA